jgi:hypothetical protein
LGRFFDENRPGTVEKTPWTRNERTRQDVVKGMRKHMIRIACLMACLVSATAAAAPSKEDLEARKTSLQNKLKGQGFIVVIEGPWVVIGDEGATKMKSRTNFVRWVTRLLEADYFTKRPDEIIEVWLFKNETTYRKGAKKFFDDEPETPYGYFSPEDNALVMNIGPGAGTLSHEMVHPYMEANFPNVPSWFNEGLASLYEQPRERDGHMWGTTNWRLPGLQSMIKAKTLPTLTTLMKTSREEFYNADFDAYAYARFLCQYLQDHGKLHDFYKKFLADTKDPSGIAALEAVVGMDVKAFQPVFEKWAASLKR